jgi:hypothetical protein
MGGLAFHRSGVSKHLTALSLPPDIIISYLQSTPLCECSASNFVRLFALLCKYIS